MLTHQRDLCTFLFRDQLYSNFSEFGPLFIWVICFRTGPGMGSSRENKIKKTSNSWKRSVAEEMTMFETTWKEMKKSAKNGSSLRGWKRIKYCALQAFVDPSRQIKRTCCK